MSLHVPAQHGIRARIDAMRWVGLETQHAAAAGAIAVNASNAIAIAITKRLILVVRRLTS